MGDVGANLALVRGRIEAALDDAGRPEGAVQLVLVSKKQPIERVEAALEAGWRVFGENYVQEAAARWGPLRERYPDVELHMIGALQSNKAEDAVALFDAIQTLDRPKLLGAIKKAIDAAGRRPRLFVQVNTGDEDQKAGVAVDGLAPLLDRARDLGLDVEGVMAIPPAGGDVTPHALMLKDLAEQHGIKGVSIGMSDDYEAAIRAGATVVRVGGAVFGARLAA